MGQMVLKAFACKDIVKLFYGNKSLIYICVFYFPISFRSSLSAKAMEVYTKHE